MHADLKPSESNPRALSSASFTNTKTMTGATCTAYCNSKGYLYGATEYASECYCGNKLSAPTSLQNDAKCAMGCAGNSSESCGGKRQHEEAFDLAADFSFS